MRTSARNEFWGKVAQVHKGAVNAEVVLTVDGGTEIVASITKGSVDRLGLAPGKEAAALVKASWVILTSGDAPRSSARNTLCGTVKAVNEGAVNGEVVLTTDGGLEVTAIVTNESIRSLGLREGGRACALVKASHLLLAVRD